MRRRAACYWSAGAAGERFEGVLLAVELPGRNGASAGEELDLPDVKPGPLIRLAGPCDAFALQRAQVRLCRARRPFSAAGEDDIVGDCPDSIAEHVMKYADQCVFAVAPLFAVEEQEYMLDTLPVIP